MSQADGKTIIFSCPPELEPILPRPIPAVLGLPDWFKAMPQKSFNPSLGAASKTVKRCPPFIDAMTYGFFIPLATDLKVENGEFSWDWTMPGGATTSYTHSPIDFHDSSQIAGTPFHDDDRYGPQTAKSVTHVSGTECHLCLGPLTRLAASSMIPKGGSG